MIPECIDMESVIAARNRFNINRDTGNGEVRILFRSEAPLEPLVHNYGTAQERKLARKRGELVEPGRRGRPVGVNGNYGQGICRACQEEFQKLCHNAETCSEACRTKYKNRLSNAARNNRRKAAR